MNAAHMVRDMLARQLAVADYSAQYEVHAEAEQKAVAEGDYGQAEKHHYACLVLLWAIDNELQNRQPVGLA